MAFLGNTALPGSGWWYDDFGNKQFWCGFTMPTGGGTASDIYCYIGGDGGFVNVRFCIWQGSTLLWAGPTQGIPGGSRKIRGQGWQHASVPSVAVAAGAVNLGLWSSGGVVWTFEGSGGVTSRSGLSAPGSASGGGDEYGGAGYGALAVYIAYTTGGGGGGGNGPHIRRSSAWGAAATGSVRRSAAWSALTAADIRRSAAWAATS